MFPLLYAHVILFSSGGTIAGLSLGSSLSSLKAKVRALYLFSFSFFIWFFHCNVTLVPCVLQVHAFSVCDDPDYFYDFVQGLLDGLEAGVSSRDIVKIQNVSDIL